MPNSPMIPIALNLFLTVALLVQPALAGLGQAVFAAKACLERGGSSSEAVSGGCGCCSGQSGASSCKCCRATAPAAPTISRADRSPGDRSNVESARVVTGGCCAESRVERRRKLATVAEELDASAQLAGMGPSLVEGSTADPEPSLCRVCFCELQPQPLGDPIPCREGAEARGADNSIVLGSLVQDWDGFRCLPVAPRRQPVTLSHYSQIHLCIWRL